MARRTREGRRIGDALLDELLAGQDPSEVFRDGSLVDELKKAVAERALGAEMDAHLGDESEQDTDNHRNGHNRKRCTRTMARWIWRYRGTARGASNRSW